MTAPGPRPRCDQSAIKPAGPPRLPELIVRVRSAATRTMTGAFARLGLSCTRVAMRRFVRSKMQVAKQIKESGGRRPVCGVFEDRMR
jgi:hypothetical protein